MFNNDFTANCPQCMPVNEFLKSVSIWRRYGQKYHGMFFDSRCIGGLVKNVGVLIFLHKRSVDVSFKVKRRPTN